jgi:iron complex outermembrane receptor protein
MERGGTLDLELKTDYVRAYNSDTGEPLPRIPPLRYGGALEYKYDLWGVRVDLTRVSNQERISVSSNELPTDGYTMLNANVTYRLSPKPGNLYAFLRGTNLLNQEARNHVSFLKDIAPLGGRALQVGLRGTF